MFILDRPRGFLLLLVVLKDDWSKKPCCHISAPHTHSLSRHLSPSLSLSLIHTHILSLFKRLCPRGTQQSTLTGDMHFPSFVLFYLFSFLSHPPLYLLSLLFQTLSVGGKLLQHIVSVMQCTVWLRVCKSMCACMSDW